MAVLLANLARPLTFYVNVNYPKVKEVKLSLSDDNIYVGNYIPLVYEITEIT